MAKSNDWRNLPIEQRQILYDALRSRHTPRATSELSRVELAIACGIDPDPDQRDILEADDQQILLNCCRQFGKSTMSAIMGLRELCYVDNSLTLIIGPSTRQASETYRKVRGFYNGLDNVPDVVGESAVKLELANDSRIVVLPGSESTIRGFSDPNLVIIEEAARVADEVYYGAIRPMLAVSGGRLALLSTPFGMRGFFAKEWHEGDDWKRVSVTGWQCPRISNEWLQKEKERIGSWWFSQEYEGVFADAVDQVFASEDILRMVEPRVLPLWN